MTVAMAVAKATHHAAPRRQMTATAIREGEVSVTHNAPRSQNTLFAGVRPGILAEPVPHMSDQRFSGNTPHLGVPSLADAPVPPQAELAAEGGGRGGEEKVGGARAAPAAGVLGWRCGARAPAHVAEEEEEEEAAENLLLLASSRCSHVETWTLFPWPVLGSTVDTFSYVSLGGFGSISCLST